MLKGGFFMVSAVIMASGFGKRMGKNKLLLPLWGKVIIEYVIEAALNSNLDEIILVGRDEGVLSIARENGVKTILNTNAHLGQSEAVKLGINNTGICDGYMFLTGDQPLINREVINILIDEFEKNKDKIVVPLCNGRRGSPVIFSKAFRNELLNLEGDTGGREVIKKHIDSVIYKTIDEEYLLMDIDTEEDYKKILNII